MPEDKFQNISARTGEQVSIICPVCGETVYFRPVVTSVSIDNAHDALEPSLIVGLRPGNRVGHACLSDEDRNVH